MPEPIRTAQGRTLAEEAGIDTDRCEFCGESLDDTQPWRRGFDGCGAHETCLEAYLGDDD